MPEIDVDVIRLRQFREARGLTQQEVTEQLARLAWARHGQRVGLNADMVSKWERGIKRPSKLYRDLLALLYEAPLDRLGIGPAPSPSTITGPSAEADRQISESLVGASAIIDELGPAGVLLQPKMFAIWKEEVMHRRTVLKLFGIAPAAVAFGEPSRAAAQGPAASVLEDLAARYQRLYHSAKPAHLMAPVLAHLATVGETIRGRVAGTLEHRQLLRNESHVGMLAGRIAFFDLHDPIGARGYYNLALEAAREANDALLAAAALGHIAFIPAAEHRYTAAGDYLEGADRQLARNPHPLVTSWLAAVQAEIQANAGNERGALEALDTADKALAADRSAAVPGWFDFYDAGRLDGFRGYTYLRFKRFTDASAALRSATTGLPAHAYKQRAVILSDAATVHLHAGELEEACRAAGHAIDLLGLADYATGADRLREFRTQLTPWKNHPIVRDLDDQLATLQ